MQNGHAKKIIALSAAAGTAVAAYFFLDKQPKAAPPPAVATAAPKPATAQTTPPQAARLAPAIALRDRYEMTYRVAVKDRSPSVLSVTGLVDVSAPSDAEPSMRIVAMSDVRVAATGPQAGAMPETALKAPWRIRYREDGGLGEASFASETPQNIRAALLQLASLCQLQTGASEKATSWSATERDGNGEYTAHYQRVSARRVRKTFGATQAMESQDVYSAVAEIDLETGVDAIESVKGKVEQRVRFAQQTIDIIIDVDLHRPAAGRVAMNDEQAATFAQALTSASPYDASKIAAPSQAAQDKQRVAGRSFERIIEDIAKADAIGNWQLRKSYGFDLAALMRLDASAIDRTLAAINAAGAAEPVRRTFIEALANSRTNKGQSALTGLMRDASTDETVASQARTVSSFVAKPIDELLDQLEKDSDSNDAKVRRPALFALASLLGTRHDNGVKDKRLTTFVERGFKVAAEYGIEPIQGAAQAGATDPTTGDPLGVATTGGLYPNANKKKVGTKLTDWLQLLGATHSLDALPILSAAIRNADHVVRSSAVLSIGRINAPEVSVLLSERALLDPTYYVRSHAVTALAHLGPSVGLQAVKTVFEKDREDSVRAEAAFTLGRWLKLDPALKPILQQQLDKESSDLVVNAILDATIPGRGYLNGTSQKVVMGSKK